MLAPADPAQHVLQAGQEGKSVEERSRAFLHAALLGSAEEAAHMRMACSSHIMARRQALQEQEALASSGEQVGCLHTALPAFGPDPVCIIDNTSGKPCLGPLSWNLPGLGKPLMLQVGPAGCSGRCCSANGPGPVCSDWASLHAP